MQLLALAQVIDAIDEKLDPKGLRMELQLGSGSSKALKGSSPQEQAQEGIRKAK